MNFVSPILEFVKHLTNLTRDFAPEWNIWVQPEPGIIKLYKKIKWHTNLYGIFAT